MTMFRKYSWNWLISQSSGQSVLSYSRVRFPSWVQCVKSNSCVPRRNVAGIWLKRRKTHSFIHNWTPQCISWWLSHWQNWQCFLVKISLSRHKNVVRSPSAPHFPHSQNDAIVIPFVVYDYINVIINPSSRSWSPQVAFYSFYDDVISKSI